MNLIGVKFWFQKLFFRLFYVFLLIFFMAVFAYAYMTEIFAPPPPSGAAPFAETLTSDVPEEGGIKSLPMDKAHRSPSEMRNWTSVAISEVMSLDGASLQNRLQEVRSYFTAAGFKQYEAYLDESGLAESLTSKALRASAYVEQEPLQLNEGAVKGVYRWLYQAPVTISYIPSNVRQYNSKVEAVNKKVNVRIQIRRVSLPDDPDAMQIESWTVTSRRN